MSMIMHSYTLSFVYIERLPCDDAINVNVRNNKVDGLNQVILIAMLLLRYDEFFIFYFGLEKLEETYFFGLMV